MAAAYSNWGLTKVKLALVFIFSWPILRFLRRKPKDAFVLFFVTSWLFQDSVLFMTTPRYFTLSSFTSMWP